MLCVILKVRFNPAVVAMYFLALLELTAQCGFAPKEEGPTSDIGSGNGRQQTGGEDGRPEEKPSDASKPYMADQQDAVRR